MSSSLGWRVGTTAWVLACIGCHRLCIKVFGSMHGNFRVASTGRIIEGAGYEGDSEFRTGRRVPSHCISLGAEFAGFEVRVADRFVLHRGLYDTVSC